MKLLGRLISKRISNEDKKGLDRNSTSEEEALNETDKSSETEEEYEVVEIEISPARIICPDCGGVTLEGLQFCDKCGGELQ